MTLMQMNGDKKWIVLKQVGDCGFECGDLFAADIADEEDFSFRFSIQIMQYHFFMPGQRLP